MMVDVGPNVLSYLAGVGATAAVVGLAIGYVVKAASARRQLVPLARENARLTTELAAAQQQTPPEQEQPPAARRLTVTELVAIAGAITTLISTTAAFYNNYQGKTVKELQDKLTAADAKQKAAEADVMKLKTDARTVLGFGIEKWVQLDKSTLPTQRPMRPEIFQVSDREVSGPCDDQRLQLSYSGFAPSILRCKGRATIRLSQPSRIMLAPDLAPK